MNIQKTIIMIDIVGLESIGKYIICYGVNM